MGYVRMNDNVTGHQINQAEWNEPANWFGPKLLGLYSSKADTRIWVPKRIPAMGWTLDVGRPGGVALLMGILVCIVGFLIAACLLASVVIGLVAVALRHAA